MSRLELVIGSKILHKLNHSFEICINFSLLVAGNLVTPHNLDKERQF